MAKAKGSGSVRMERDGHGKSYLARTAGQGKAHLERLLNKASKVVRRK